MKLICTAFGVAALCAVGVGAQTTQTTEKTKVEVKDGKEITVSGCVERNPDGGYLLTSTRTGDMKYALVTSDDLSKHVGHRVEVKGRATDRGDAKVKVEQKSETAREYGSDKDGKVKSEMKGDLPGMHYLGVKSLKMLSESCM